MNKFSLIILGVSFFLFSCTKDESCGQGNLIDFSTGIEKTKAHVADGNNIRSFGVMAYYTGTGDFDESPDTGHIPDFMYDQAVERESEESSWIYSPIRYWPADPNEKITFFSYSPHSSRSGGYLKISEENVKGTPSVAYRVPEEIGRQLDLTVSRPVSNRRASGGDIVFEQAHVLASVVFSGKITTVPPPGVSVKVTGVCIKGFKNEGIIPMIPEEDWILDANSKGSYNDTDLMDLSLTTESQVLSKDGRSIMLLPQTLVPAESMITVSVTVADNGVDRSYEVTKDLAGLLPAFEKGIKYNISLAYNLATDFNLTYQVTGWNNNSIGVDDSNYYLSILDKELMFEAKASERFMLVQTDCPAGFTHSIDDMYNWIQMEGNKVKVSENGTGEKRVGYIIVSAGRISKEIKITQEGS